MLVQVGQIRVNAPEPESSHGRVNLATLDGGQQCFILTEGCRQPACNL